MIIRDCDVLEVSRSNQHEPCTLLEAISHRERHKFDQLVIFMSEWKHVSVSPASNCTILSDEDQHSEAGGLSKMLDCPAGESHPIVLAYVSAPKYHEL